MSIRIKSFSRLTILLCFTLLISACSNNNDAQSGANGEQQEKSQDDKVIQQSEFPRTIKAANGEIMIEKEPKKVAVVHWGYIDSLLLFDLESVAAALPFTEKQSELKTESYKLYVDKLDELVIVGENTTVNLEALLAYEPDLIIAGNSINQEISTELSRIATTVIIDEEETNVWEDWQPLVTKFGEILGQEDVAESYISEYRSHMQAAKDKLANLEGTVAFVQVREKEVWLQGTDYLKQYYDDGLGLKAPVADSMKEGALITLEGLSALDPDYLFLGYFNYSDQTIPALTDEWNDSAVWSALKAVQNDQVYPINGELALGYGPIGNSYGVEAILEALE